MIVRALTAGATATRQDGAEPAVKSAYARVRDLAGRQLGDPGSAEFLMSKHAQDPETWGKPLARELEQAGAARDADLVTASGELMKLLDPRGSQAGKYTVSVRGSQGVQIGDGNTQVNHSGGTTVRAGRDAYVAGRDMRIHRPDAGD